MGNIIDNLRNVFEDEYGDEIYIIVFVPELFIKTLPNLEESIWHSKGNLKYRIDPPNPSLDIQRHIHISNKQNITAKSKQVSWNENGSRHDKHSFNVSMKGLEKAKRLARKVLDLDQDIIFETYGFSGSISESIDPLYDTSQVFVLRIYDDK